MPLARHLLWCAKALLCLSLPAALTAAQPAAAAAADAPAFSGPATVPVAADGAFDIRWHDNNPATAAGATVSLYHDRDDRGFDGTLVAAGVAQHDGVNRDRWDTGGLPTGRYWVQVVADGAVATGRSYSTGPPAGTFTPASYGPRVAAARTAGAHR